MMFSRVIFPRKTVPKVPTFFGARNVPRTNLFSKGIKCTWTPRRNLFVDSDTGAMFTPPPMRELREIKVGKSDFVDLLKETKVGEIIDTRPALLSVRSDDTVASLLFVLARGNVWGVIVMDSRYPDTQHTLGFVDVLDITTALTQRLTGTLDPHAKTYSREQIFFIQEQGHRFAQERVDNIINLSGRDQVFSVTENSDLSKAIEMLTSAHRIVVRGTEGNFKGILAQSDIVNFLFQRHIFRGGPLERSVRDIGLIPKEKLEFVDEETTVLGALKKMSDLHISGLPVLSKDGKIVTNLSASDLVGISEDSLVLLTRPVSEFLNELHGYVKPPVSCRETDSLEKILLQIHHHKVHRIYIVDENMKPKGFLSLTDIMKYLSKAK